jgi:hypothetical protein
MGHAREIRSIDELMQNPLAIKAKLTREEMIAVVMYTGPAFVVYNAILRRWPTDIYDVFATADNLFTTTIFVLVSAIQKLSRCMNIPLGMLLFRGLGGTLDFPDSFNRADARCVTPNALGYTEFGFMSTTAERGVAIEYSGVKDGKPKASILQIRPSSVDRGADISEFSQYPAEKEWLFVPYSFVQGEGRQRTEVVAGGGVITVVSVRVNINLKTETVEELKEKKKRLHLASARAMVDELRCELGEWSASDQALARLQRDESRNKQGAKTPATLAASILEQCAAVVKRHEAAGVEDYVDDGAFRALASEMLDTKAWAKEKMHLWMQDETQYIQFLQGNSLRHCHRFWQAFLRKRIAGADTAGSSERASASMQLLVSRGLVKRGVRGEVNFDGEDVLVRAGGDGWAAADIAAAAAAGADVRATLDGCNGAWHAARYGHAESLAAMIAPGCDWNEPNRKGATPLYSASRAGHLACLVQLLSVKADVDRCNDDGYSPVYAAAGNGHACCLAQLLAAKANVDKCDHACGASPVFAASRRGYEACLTQLLAARADVNTCDNEGRSPVFTAADRDRAACLKQLLAAGADPQSSWHGTTALDAARLKGHAECARLLEAELQ